MKKLTVLISCALVVLSFAAINLQLSPGVFASPKDQICEGIDAAGEGDGCGNATELSDVITAVINIFSVIIGITAVIMIMVAGFKYITASGDSSHITSAKHTLIYAIVGLVIVAFAQAIVQFVLDKV